MTKNMGTIDRVLRIALAVVVAILYLAGAISGWAAIILGVLAIVFLLTGLLGSNTFLQNNGLITLLLITGLAAGIIYWKQEPPKV